MKHAVVTGASTGIGRATAIALASHDFFIYLLARRKEKLEETKKFITDHGGKAEIIPSDFSSADSINKAIQTIKSKTTQIDLLANIAGIWHGVNEVHADKDFETFDQQVILDTYAVGLTAPTLLTHGLIPLMLKGSHIVNISGTFNSGAKGWLPYYVSKRGIEDLTVALSQELKDKGIYVNCISPSDVATEEYIKYFPEYAKDASSPEDIANAVVNFISSATTGQFIVVEKGVSKQNGFHQ